MRDSQLFRINRNGITDHYPCFALALLAWIDGGMIGDVEEESAGSWYAYSPRYLRCCALLTNPPPQFAVA